MRRGTWADRGLEAGTSGPGEGCYPGQLRPRGRDGTGRILTGEPGGQLSQLGSVADSGLIAGFLIPSSSSENKVLFDQ